jgi:hypothetical protein
MQRQVRRFNISVRRMGSIFLTGQEILMSTIRWGDAARSKQCSRIVWK